MSIRQAPVIGLNFTFKKCKILEDSWLLTAEEIRKHGVVMAVNPWTGAHLSLMNVLDGHSE